MSEWATIRSTASDCWCKGLLATAIAKSELSIRHDLVRRQSRVRNRDSFADSQFEGAAGEAGRNSINLHLCHRTARNDDGLRALSDRVAPSAHRVGAPASIVRQVPAGTPWI